MKKICALLLLLVVAGLILHPVTSQVNTQPSNVASQSFAADGSPLPPIWPPSAVGAVLVADGSPLPPIWPPSAVGAVLVADGSPLPPIWPPSVVGPALA
jgi:hypothetical protein